jgi:2-methylcitrate dehydratase PrpD
MAERDRDLPVSFAEVAAFIHGLTFDHLPAEIVASARRSLLDLIGVAAGGSRTRAAAIAATYAATQLCGSDRSARILFDGRRAGVAGAAFAGAATIDALDAHDGHVLTKGHAGVALLPALLALVDGSHPGERAHEVDAGEFLACLVIGCEIATRAGLALHASVADYHCSGAWNALGCAAIASRLLGFNEIRTRHALGCAEYFAPRGQILRVCESPTMVKDGSGWGAHVGVTAALLAREGFTGAPALTVERDGAAEFWRDLGTRWRLCEQYFKPYPVCRWAQPAIEAALELQRAHAFTADQVEAVVVETFREAVALGSQCAMPSTTEEAQYNLAFPVAAALVFGSVGFDEVATTGLADSRVERLVRSTRASEDPELSSRFPAERWARVRIALADGRIFTSSPAQARGGAENPLSDRELCDKYRELATPVLGSGRASRIETAVDRLAIDGEALPALVEDLLNTAARRD